MCGAVAEERAGQVPFGRRDDGGVAVQGAPHGVPPHKGPVGGEHADRNVAEPRGQPLDAWGHMGADRPVPGRQEPGASVQLVALGAGELKGPGEGADDLGRGVLRASLFQAQDIVDGDPGQLRQFLAAQPRGPAAVRRCETGVGRERRSRQARRSAAKSEREAAMGSFSPSGDTSAWVLPVLVTGTALAGDGTSGERGAGPEPGHIG